jgi:hypothetical protein
LFSFIWFVYLLEGYWQQRRDPEDPKLPYPKHSYQYSDQLTAINLTNRILDTGNSNKMFIRWLDRHIGAANCCDTLGYR